jgi:hypothetical protein
MIIRREKNKNYSIIANECIKNSKISSRARAMYVFIMTLPDDWRLSKKELYTHFPEGRDYLDKGFDELKEWGYIDQNRVKDDLGRYVGWEYIVYEFSTKNPLKTNNKTTPKSEEIQTSVKPQSDIPKSGNPHLLKTDKKQNTKRKLNTKLPKNTVVEESPQVKDTESVQSVSPSSPFFLEETAQSVDARNNQTQEDLVSLGLSISQIKALFRVYELSVLCEAVITTFQAQYEMRIDTTQAQYFYGSLKKISSKNEGHNYE